MEPWKLALDEAAFQFLIARPASDRRRLLAIFEELRRDPYRTADYQSRDTTGRGLPVAAVRPFLMTYWLDSFVSEIRIVNIQRIEL